VSQCWFYHLFFTLAKNTYLCEFVEFLEELLFKLLLLLDDEFEFLFDPFLFLFIIFHPFNTYLPKIMFYSVQQKEH